MTDSIEGNARKRHGFLYDLTWEASSTAKKWLWAVVAIFEIGKMALSGAFFSLILTAVSHGLLKLTFGNGYQQYFLEWYSLTLSFLVGLLVWLCAELVFGSRFVGVASSFYAIASDMVRMKSNKPFVRLAYLASGGIAVMLALLSWWMRTFRITPFISTELDVLGSIFSKVNLWKQSREIYKKVGDLYFGHHGKSEEERMQLAVSYALATKWMLKDPTLTKVASCTYRTAIMDIVLEYEGDLGPEILARLQEALGDTEQVKQERAKIAAKFS
jgi:hypothetical protein